MIEFSHGVLSVDLKAIYFGLEYLVSEYAAGMFVFWVCFGAIATFFVSLLDCLVFGRYLERDNQRLYLVFMSVLLWPVTLPHAVSCAHALWSELDRPYPARHYDDLDW